MGIQSNRFWVLRKQQAHDAEWFAPALTGPLSDVNAVDRRLYKLFLHDDVLLPLGNVIYVLPLLASPAKRLIMSVR